MSLFSTLATGASGMAASSTNLSVIGDNIANVGTTGYKSSGATFADMLPNFVAGLGGLNAIGSGSRLSAIRSDFGQGGMETASSPLDIAIVGNGFFQVANGDERYYTRDGSFNLDVDSFITNAAGMRLQGYQAVNGTLTATVADIQIDTAGVQAQPTAAITIDATLSAEADFTTMPFDTLRTASPLDGTNLAPTMDQLSPLADFASSVTVYDSLGIPHDVTVFYERDSAAPDTWNMTAVVDGGEVDTTGDGIPDGVAGHAFEIGAGTVQFDTTGQLIANSGITPTPGWTFPGADPFAATFEIGLTPAGATGPGSLRMTGSTSYLSTIQQDGYAAGSLDSLKVDTDGTIVGSYTNGTEQLLGRVALATFSAQGGLERMGGNLFRATMDSGEPSLGIPGEGGRGSTNGYALEASNVELEDQFIGMIESQRTYQANTKVIRSIDEALQDLVNLV